jgi:hypothetical protein
LFDSTDRELIVIVVVVMVSVMTIDDAEQKRADALINDGGLG